jgi:hypothetical protein
VSPGLAAAANLGRRAGRRLGRVHAPALRLARRWGRAGEQVRDRLGEYRVLRRIAAVADGDGPIVVGPWLGEVGYEALYWVPFVRWFARAHRVPARRLTIVSRGGVAAWYRDIADRYVEVFDLYPPGTFAERNAARQQAVEAGGQKQSGTDAFDLEILARVLPDHGLGRARVLHPALMFRLFARFWLGRRAPDFLWRHTTHAMLEVAPPSGFALPDRYVAMKCYTGRALPDVPEVRGALRRVVAAVAAHTPVVLLETRFAPDEHADHALADVPGVQCLAAPLEPSTNLGLQTRIIAGAERFIGTCGGLAWLAPLMGVPTVGLYADDRLLATHLAVARQAYRRLGAGPFSPLDVRALGALDAGALPAGGDGKLR